MSVTTLTPSSGGKKKAPKRRGPYLVAKLERGLFEERHTARTVRYRCRYQKASGVSAEVTLTAKTRTEARAEAARLRAQVSDGMFVAPTKLTVKELWESWREEWEALIASGERRPRIDAKRRGATQEVVLAPDRRPEGDRRSPRARPAHPR